MYQWNVNIIVSYRQFNLSYESILLDKCVWLKQVTDNQITNVNMILFYLVSMQILIEL